MFRIVQYSTWRWYVTDRLSDGGRVWGTVVSGVGGSELCVWVGGESYESRVDPFLSTTVLVTRP